VGEPGAQPASRQEARLCQPGVRSIRKRTAKGESDKGRGKILEGAIYAGKSCGSRALRGDPGHDYQVGETPAPGWGTAGKHGEGRGACRKDANPINFLKRAWDQKITAICE